MTRCGLCADTLLEALPVFGSSCEKFVATAHTISARRAVSRLTLQYHAQILEVLRPLCCHLCCVRADACICVAQLLEIPQLMDTCVRNGFYEEALQLEQFAQRFSKMHPDIKLVQDVVCH